MVTVFAVTMFFSCKDNYNKIQQQQGYRKFPAGETTNVVLQYTKINKKIPIDSITKTQLTAILRSPLSLDFTNQEFPYYEFPNGLEVDFFDEENQKSTIKADYGILYKQTNLVDLRKNVRIQSHDGKKMNAEQMFWDQGNQWIFTEHAYTLKSPDINLEGNGIDFNRNFTYVYTPYKQGTYTVKEEQ